MWYINIILNNKGAKLFGSDTKVFEYNSINKPNIDEINSFINDEFVPELVDRIGDIWSDYSYLKNGDVIKVITPNKDGSETISFAEVASVQNDGYGKEIHAYLRDIENYSNYYCSSNYIRFNFAGREIGGSRKFKRYLEIPNAEEIQRFENAKNKINIYNEVLEMLKHKEEWEDDYDIPKYVTLDMLVNMRDILRNAYNNYYEVTD